MKIVLDTNVLISALIKEGKSRKLFFEILLNHELIISKEILKEVVEVASERRIRSGCKWKLSLGNSGNGNSDSSNLPNEST